MFVSPRQRAQKTFYTIFEGHDLPPHETTESITEWDYGEYEGLILSEIKQRNPTWNIWKDGCPGGESVEDVTKRIDEMIDKVREYHRLYKEEGKGKRDSQFKRQSRAVRLIPMVVMIVAHGHILRCFVSRWIGFPLCLGVSVWRYQKNPLDRITGTHFNVEPAGIAMLTYQHDNREHVPSLCGGKLNESSVSG